MPTTYNVFDVYWTNLKDAIVTTWPEVDGKIFQDVSIERRDWVNELDKGDLTAPWCIVVFDTEQTDEWGAKPHMMIKPTIYYCTSLALAKAASKPAATFIAGKLLALQESMFNDQYTGTTLNETVLDVTAENPVNVSFLANKGDYQGGSIMFQSIVPSEFTVTI
jgi:hypothetical protein